MTTEQTLNLLIKIEEPAFALIEKMQKDSDVIITLAKVKENNNNIYKLKFLMLLVKNYKEEIYKILALIEDVSVEEIANRKLEDNINKIKELFSVGVGSFF